MKGMFCPKCNKILEISKENEKTIGSCICGHVQETMINSNEKLIKKPKIAKGVFQPHESKEGFPNVCEKCGYVEADVIDLGAPYSDESNIYLFKCKKCNFVKRQTDGTSN